MKLLLLEDDITIGEGLRDFLISEWHQVDWVKLIGQAQMRISDDHDAWLLDWNLPDGSGVEWLASLRKQSYTTPAIVLTARDLLADRILGLDSGADDFIVKPFAPEELCARLRALSRRSSGGHLTQTWGDIAIDLPHKKAWRGEVAVTLTAKEWAILEALIARAGRPLSRDGIEALIDDGLSHELASNAIEVHISSLRKKLGKHFIQTHRGLGYLVQAAPNRSVVR